MNSNSGLGISIIIYSVKCMLIFNQWPIYNRTPEKLIKQYSWYMGLP